MSHRKDHELKLSPRTVATIGIAPMAAGLIGAAIATTPPVMASSAPRASATVATFNDGFADAKLDDCQQGFAPACAWLNHRKPAGVPWLHVQAAPRWVARDACGRWPQYGLGKDMRGQVVPGAEVWPLNEHGQQVTDGVVICRSGKVAGP